MNKPSKWQTTSTGDDCTQTRVIIGRITRKRYECIKRIVKGLQDLHPYGKGYRCGCAHDCCGCLVATYSSVQFQHYMGGFKVSISVTQAFNY